MIRGVSAVDVEDAARKLSQSGSTRHRRTDTLPTFNAGRSIKALERCYYGLVVCAREARHKSETICQGIV